MDSCQFKSTHHYHSSPFNHTLSVSLSKPGSPNHSKMKFTLLTAAFMVSAFALPDLLARDNVKLNQYRTLDDW